MFCMQCWNASTCAISISDSIDSIIILSAAGAAVAHQMTDIIIMAYRGWSPDPYSDMPL